MTKMLLYGCLFLFILSCQNSIDSANTQTKKATFKGAKNLLFNEEVTFYLDSILERYNLQELDLVLKSKNSNPLMKAFFNEEFISYYARMDKQMYYFIDTSNYQNFFIFQKLPRHHYLGQDNAQIVILNLEEQTAKQLGIDRQNITHSPITYGSTNGFQHIHALFDINLGPIILYSNCIAFTTKTKSFLIQNYSTERTNYSYLTDQIKLP